jgi:hypothetical protein
MSTPLDAIAAKLDALSDRSAPAPRTPGAWTLGQALAHCAQSINYSTDRYPKLRSPIFRATIGKLAKRKFLSAGRMSHDTNAAIPGAPAIDVVDFEAGRELLRAAIAGFLLSKEPLAVHLAYGRCTWDEYAALHAMHVDDHLRAFTD